MQDLEAAGLQYHARRASDKPGLEINFFSYVPIGQVIPNFGCPC